MTQRLQQTIIRNLEQLRAQRALQDTERNLSKESVKKLPAMIQQNGLMGAMAFALDKGGNYSTIFACVINHLQSNEVRLVNLPVRNYTGDDDRLKAMLQHLGGNISATQLRRVTAETMAYLNYLRRFA